MKTILIPTDFSAGADKALEYGLMIAESLDARILLLNVYGLPYASAYVPFETIREERYLVGKRIKEQLGTLIRRIALHRFSRYETYSVEGDPRQVIPEFAMETKADLIVMGTKGATGLAGALIGSVTSHVIGKAVCPVLAIPAEAEIRPLRKITFASDLNEGDIDAIRELAAFAAHFNAVIAVLHISPADEPQELTEARSASFLAEIRKQVTYERIEMENMTSDDVVKALEVRLADASCDLLVLSTHDRSYLERMFDRSITRHLVRHPAVPVMAFHYAGEHADVHN